MVRMLLVRGMIAGAVAGLAALVFGFVFGEPGIEGGIAFEDRHATHAGVDLVGRGVQSTLGLAVALVLYGIAIGGIFALVYAVLYGRLGRLSPRGSAAVLALVAFLAVIVVPFVKYPANPPGASDPDTISERTAFYLAMVLASVALAAAATMLGRKLAGRLGAWNAFLVAVATYLVAIGLVMRALPPVDEAPPGFPATVLYEFRLASLGAQLTFWAVLGLVFGAVVDRGGRRADRGAGMRSGAP
ncbi:CbtA family protein [Pseudonocardia hispaniensis]|uniref:CbtA family protein n=1 Tax=Pseudonocardia hispaniensis TaxID=904933 RepID=A0ABW1IWY7_9PSEU